MSDKPDSTQKPSSPPPPQPPPTNPTEIKGGGERPRPEEGPKSTKIYTGQRDK